MNQNQRRIRLIEELLQEQNQNLKIPKDKNSQEMLLRGLMNIRMPQRTSDIFLNIQNAYLKERIRERKITDVEELYPFKDQIYLWQGDITTLKCDAIVNAANAQMLGCFIPNHRCIDNAIHTFAGIELREECAALMAALGRQAYTGEAYITSGYNLPAKHVIHTIGPIVNGNPTKENKENLEKCYLSCLKLADSKNLQSIAFCCISTGEFHYPNEGAALIAIDTVLNYIKKTKSKMKVIFNVFKEVDYEIYRRLLKQNC